MGSCAPDCGGWVAGQAAAAGPLGSWASSGWVAGKGSFQAAHGRPAGDRPHLTMRERCAATATRRNQRPGGELMSSALALRPRSTHLGLGSCGAGVGRGRVWKLVMKAGTTGVEGRWRARGAPAAGSPPATMATRRPAGAQQRLARARRPRPGGEQSKLPRPPPPLTSQPRTRPTSQTASHCHAHDWASAQLNSRGASHSAPIAAEATARPAGALPARAGLPDSRRGGGEGAAGAGGAEKGGRWGVG